VSPRTRRTTSHREIREIGEIPDAGCHHLSELLSNQKRLPLAEVAGYAERRLISWGATSWQIAFDVLDRLLSGAPIGRIVGAEAMKFEGWQRLSAEYAKQFGR
jgi:hypothetical protein